MLLLSPYLGLSDNVVAADTAKGDDGNVEYETKLPRSIQQLIQVCNQDNTFSPVEVVLLEGGGHEGHRHEESSSKTKTGSPRPSVIEAM